MMDLKNHTERLYSSLNQSGLSLCRMELKFSAHTYFLMRNSNHNSIPTENQHEILMKFGKCLYHNWSRNYAVL